MYGLSQQEWQDLVLSLNVHRKQRRLSPVQAAKLLRRALEDTDVDSLATALGFGDTTTMSKIARLADLPDDLASTVEWGTRKGSLSMSTAAELMRLPPTDLRYAITAAIENSVTRDEARQIVQIRDRSDDKIADCIASALRGRPIVERSELIIGSLLTPAAQQRSEALGDETLTKRLKIALARQFPHVVFQSVRVNGRRFSLLFSEQEAQTFRREIGAESVEEVITRVVGNLKLE